MGVQPRLPSTPSPSPSSKLPSDEEEKPGQCTGDVGWCGGTSIVAGTGDRVARGKVQLLLSKKRYQTTTAKLPVPARTQHVPAQSELPQHRALGCRHGAMAPLALTAGWIQPRPAGGAANATSTRAGRPLALATCCSGTRTRPGAVLPTAPVREHYEPLPATAGGASPQPRLLLRG